MIFFPLLVGSLLMLSLQGYTPVKEIVLKKDVRISDITRIRDYYFHPQTGWAILGGHPFKEPKTGREIWEPWKDTQVVQLFDLEQHWKQDIRPDIRVWKVVYYGPTGLILAERSEEGIIRLHLWAKGKVQQSYSFPKIKDAGTTRFILNTSDFPGEVYCDRLIGIDLENGQWALLNRSLQVVASSEESGYGKFLSAACSPELIGILLQGKENAFLLQYEIKTGKVRKYDLPALGYSDAWATTDGGVQLMKTRAPSGETQEIWKVRKVEVSPIPKVRIWLLKKGEEIPPSALPEISHYIQPAYPGFAFYGEVPGYPHRVEIPEIMKKSPSPIVRKMKYLFDSMPGKVFPQINDVCQKDETAVICWNWKKNTIDRIFVHPHTLWYTVASPDSDFIDFILSDSRVRIGYKTYSLPDLKDLGISEDPADKSGKELYYDRNVVTAVNEHNQIYRGYEEGAGPDVHHPTTQPHFVWWNTITLETLKFPKNLFPTRGSSPAIRQGKMLISHDSEKNVTWMDASTGNVKEIPLPQNWIGTNERWIFPTREGWMLLLFNLKTWKFGIWRLSPEGKSLGEPKPFSKELSEILHLSYRRKWYALADGRILIIGISIVAKTIPTPDEGKTILTFVFLNQKGDILAYPQVEEELPDCYHYSVFARQEGDVYIGCKTKITRVTFK